MKKPKYVRRKARFSIGQVICDKDIIPRIFGVVVTVGGKRRIAPFYFDSNKQFFVDFENWRPLTAKEIGPRRKRV
ncbi:hypothetical protein LCGC14_1510150 [marine sediment metagenome]|uniref:Uncharacterized protein n=1 Tax=marine sediment metagenome TaxID=412755 RepID=A0A0F9LH12_9ZZZZ